MSLNKFTSVQTGLDLKLNIGCDNFECNNFITENLTVNKLLVNEELKVVNDDSTFTNYTAPSNGDLGDVLSTDGNGHVYWSSNPVPPGSGIIYNGSLPSTVNTILKSSNITGTTCNESCLNESSTELNSTKDIYINTIKVATINDIPSQTFQDVYNNSSNPAEVVLVNNKPIIFKDTLDNVALYISSDGITTQAGGVTGGFYNSKMNTIQRAYTGDTKIEVIEDIPLTTVRTIFTDNQEFVSKLYVDSQVGSIPSLQQVIDNSGVPTLCVVQYGNEIEFRTPDSDNILSINSFDSINYGITAEKAILDNLNSTTSTSGSFIKVGGTSNQYLMADGSSLQYSQNSGNSNFYLYDSQNGAGSPPIPNGHIEYNNIVQANATIIYISHLTSDGIDIDVFFAQITTIQDVYIQDKNSSLNFIKYNITGTPTIFTNSYISIPVLYTATTPPALPNGAGTGLTSFGNNHPIIISFFTNSIEVDSRLTSLETKTQYIDIVAPNVMGITSNILGVKSLYSYVDSTALPIGFNSSSVNILAPNLITNTILATTDDTYDLGYPPNQFRRGYFGTALRCPVYDVATSIPLYIGPTIATAVNIGRPFTTTTIIGTTNINNAYTLPSTAPALNQVITCSSLGVSTWITPSVGAFSFVYPYPTANRTVITGSGTRTLCNTYTMTSNVTFSSASLFFPITGSDNTRVAIYRGDLTTGVLVGQTVSGAPSSAYFTRTITAVVGQSLTFTVGQQVVIAFTQNGSTTSIATTTGISNLALAFISSTGYAAAGFPPLISGILLPAATIIRKNIDLY